MGKNDKISGSNQFLGIQYKRGNYNSAFFYPYQFQSPLLLPTSRNQPIIYRDERSRIKLPAHALQESLDIFQHNARLSEINEKHYQPTEIVLIQFHSPPPPNPHKRLVAQHRARHQEQVRRHHRSLIRTWKEIELKRKTPEIF